MKRKKAAILISALVLLTVSGAAAAFIVTRPEIVFVSDPLPKEYMRRLEKPSLLTSSRRLTVKDSYGYVDDGSPVIDITRDGIATESPVVRPFLSPVELFSPLLPSLAGEHITLIYDETDDYEEELSEIISEMFPESDMIPYRYEMNRSEFGILSSTLEEDTVLLIPDLYPALDFVRSLESPRLALDWLDAAALETIEPEFVASPDWEEIISALLSGSV